MSKALQLFVLAMCVSGTLGLLCYNCSTTHTASSACAGDFTPPYHPFNDTAELVVNCSAGNAMCFVRAWRARARHAWIVQRGCYQAVDTVNDFVPKLMKMPTRAMSCSHRRLSEAEYKVCLCRADWCNSAPSFVAPRDFVLYISTIVYLLPF